MTTVAITRVEVLQTGHPSKAPKKPQVPNDFEVTNASISTSHLDMEIPPDSDYWAVFFHPSANPCMDLHTDPCMALYPQPTTNNKYQ